MAVAMAMSTMLMATLVNYSLFGNDTSVNKPVVIPMVGRPADMVPGVAEAVPFGERGPSSADINQVFMAGMVR